MVVNCKPVTGTSILDPKTQKIYEYYQASRAELESISASTGKGLPRHEVWRHTYYCLPYLLLEDDSAVRARFVDVFPNTVTLSKDGKIVPEDYLRNGFRFTELFTHLHTEMEQRSIFHDSTLQREATSGIAAYFANGEPIGVRLFRDRDVAPNNCLVKFTKRRFAEDMFKFGRVRISPASSYSQGSLLKAMRDLETEKFYRILAINEAISGRSHIHFEGVKLPIIGGNIIFHFTVQDYYLYSTCNELDRRMPTDFDSDAAVVVKDKMRFVLKLREHLSRIKPDWDFLEGNVKYYDPYLDVPDSRDQEFFKHLAYAYQKEHRCVLRRRSNSQVEDPLEPFFVEIGPLDDCAELVTV